MVIHSEKIQTRKCRMHQIIKTPTGRFNPESQIDLLLNIPSFLTAPATCFQQARAATAACTDNATTKYEYDPNGGEEQFAYDDFGRLTEKITPLGDAHLF